MVQRYCLSKMRHILGGEKAEEKDTGEYLELGKIRIHVKFNEVFLGGKEKNLSDIEYHILLLMMQHPQKIFSAQNLYESVWDDPYFYTCSGTIIMYIRRIRGKIEQNAQEPEYIRTVWGKGYKFGA